MPFLVMAAAAQAAPPQPLGCLIEPYQSSDVGSPVVGVIETLHVDRGDRVTRGQPLATLRADVERSSVAVAESRAQAVGEVRAAEANAELARQKLARAEDLARQQFISTQAVEQARAETRVAENRLAQAREQQGIYAREHDLARAQLGLRTIRSPSSGVVADRFMAAGERVEERPIFRVAVDDPLRAEVVLPASLFTSVRIGMAMAIQPEFPGAPPRKARVVLVDRVIEGASNTFRIRLELPNPDRALPAGLRCKAEFSDVDFALTPPARRPAPQPAAAALNPNGGMQLRASPTLGAVPAGRP
ncbi:efflux RND transporter periplasmic adaptor subunit [Caenimonas sedimenti]|uniref:efflux RND transporter periplasmic adaptor subunit n=1 Tax=Caenimonas sedimenti TaxID=2596921 RepID=UPI001647AC12|nr:efflux RND transporter periplasmic adaptor subunit [Caenimonas sedimenti]